MTIRRDDAVGPRVTLADRIDDARDRLLSSPRFQRFAASFPFTRPTARRHAQGVFDLCAGFVYSQILFACVRLHLFDALQKGPKTLDEIALLTGLPVDAADRLLTAAMSLKLIERRRNGRFGLGLYGAALSANPSVAAMIEHHAMLYADLQDPIALLRGDREASPLARYRRR